VTAHPLDDPATIRSHELACTWTVGDGDTIPAVLTTSRTAVGWWMSHTAVGWWVCVTPDGWSTLWLADDEAQPWGPWRSDSPFRWFDSARDAVDAALATDQIGAAG
jgi:hypothetical protein